MNPLCHLLHCCCLQNFDLRLFRFCLVELHCEAETAVQRLLSLSPLPADHAVMVTILDRIDILIRRAPRINSLPLKLARANASTTAFGGSLKGFELSLHAQRNLVTSATSSIYKTALRV